MGSGSGTRKRRRAGAAGDRLGDLPDCLLHAILSLLGSRQVVQTSVLSRRWRNLWRDVPCVHIDDGDFTNHGGALRPLWERLEDLADRLLTLTRPGTWQLDAFRLHLATRGSNRGASGRWIRRALPLLPAAVDIRATPDHAVSWSPHISPCLPCPSACAAGFTRRLKTLRLVGVNVAPGFLEDLGRHCPTLEEFHAERCIMPMSALQLQSPTLTRLTIIQARGYRAAAAPRLLAPRLASLRLDILYDSGEVAGVGAAASERLTALTEASIRLKAADEHVRQQPKLKFSKSMAGFLALLPNVVNLHLQGFNNMALLEKESQEFPLLHNLRSLLLEECDVGISFQALASILRNTPNLEKLALHMCMFVAPPIVKKLKEMPSSISHGATPVESVGFWCKKLKMLEIKRRQQDDRHMARVLSQISKGMLLAQRTQVKTSCTIVPG